MICYILTSVDLSIMLLETVVGLLFLSKVTESLNNG